MNRRLGGLLVWCGLLGFAASFILAYEKFELLENPLYVPACSINEAVDCGSVMRSPQAEVLGFPNAFLGIAGFPALGLFGALLFTGGTLTRPIWITLRVGLTLAVVFVHWLAFQSLYRIGALCPFCIAMWLAVISASWYVTLHSVAGAAGRPGALGRAAAAARANHGVILTVWLLLIAAAILERFWTP